MVSARAVSTCLFALTLLAATARADPRPTEPAQAYFATEYEGAHWLHHRAHRGTGPVYIVTGPAAAQYANLPAVPLPVPVQAVIQVPVPAPVVVPVAVPVVVVQEAPVFRAGGSFDYQLASAQNAASLSTFAENKRWGVNLGYLSRFDDLKSGSWHGPRLLDAHLTFSPLSGQRGRVRLEGGVAGAMVPEYTLVGPSVGFSAELRVLWIFGVGLSGHITPFPFYRQELKQTVFAGIGPVRVEAGYRSTKMELNNNELSCTQGFFGGLSIIL